MIIQCQGCQKKININEKKIPAGVKQAKCKTCGGTILLSPVRQKSAISLDKRVKSCATSGETARKEQIKNGPFGLWMGMTKSDFEGPIEEIAPCKFRASVVPKPHSAFDMYVCQITPKSGLSWIKALGKTIEGNSYGSQLKLAFDAMEQKLSNIYGIIKGKIFYSQAVYGASRVIGCRGFLAKIAFYILNGKKKRGHP